MTRAEVVHLLAKEREWRAAQETAHWALVSFTIEEERRRGELAVREERDRGGVGIEGGEGKRDYSSEGSHEEGSGEARGVVESKAGGGSERLRERERGESKGQ